jgi:hypothetical protein
MHLNLSTVSTKQQRVATLAKQSPQMGFTSLAHLMDIDWLKEAYRHIRKDAAAGVDGVTATDYEANLEGNLQELLDRAKAGTYQAPPLRRAYIPVLPSRAYCGLEKADMVRTLEVSEIQPSRGEPCPLAYSIIPLAFVATSIVEPSLSRAA